MLLEGIRMDMMLDMAFETDNEERMWMENSKYLSPGMKEGQELV